MATTPDLFMTWKEMYDRTESLLTKPLQTVMGTEGFVEAMSATREGVLHQQKMSRELWEQHWGQLRLPTKTDHARLAAQVVALETKIEGLESSLVGLEGKLDAVLNKLAAIAERMPTTEPGDSEPAKRRSTK